MTGELVEKILAISLALFSTVLSANPTIFGMKLGETSEQSLKEKYNLSYTGVNKYTAGNMYTIPAGAINFEGLEEVTVIFGKDKKLMAVLTTLPKSKFDYLSTILSGKYTLVNQRIPFVGNKSATYREGSTEIKLEAPHMSFQMSMNYIQDNLLKAYNHQQKEEQQKKIVNESSLL